MEYVIYVLIRIKKIIEILIILNVVTIIIVLYIFSSVYNFKIDLGTDDMEENGEYDDNKYTYLSFVNNARNNENQNFRDIFQEDL